MPLTQLNVAGYRSLRKIELPLGRLNVVTGANGSGKSNLYRALWLISRISEGEFARTIAAEGGMLSALWAGPRLNARTPVRISLGFSTEEFHFSLSCGFPAPGGGTLFCYDPEIKEEHIWFGKRRIPSTILVERKGGFARVRDLDGNAVDYPLTLSENESLLSQLRDPHQFPELFRIRDEIRGWRFYHQFRTDEGAPARRPRVSVRTAVLGDYGDDLAAALQTILEIGEASRLHAAVEAALPGRRIVILPGEAFEGSHGPRFTELQLGLKTHGVNRMLLAHELSDGTLKFLCLAAALLSPRPPGMLALNEPENSLHPDLLRPLARLIVDAAELSQVWVSTHSQTLVEEIERLSGVKAVDLRLEQGETALPEVDHD